MGVAGKSYSEIDKLLMEIKAGASHIDNLLYMNQHLISPETQFTVEAIHRELRTMKHNIDSVRS